MSNRLSQVSTDVQVQSDETIQARVSQVAAEPFVQSDEIIYLRVSQVALDVLVLATATAERSRFHWSS